MRDIGNSFSILFKSLRQYGPDWEHKTSMQFTIFLACREQHYDIVGRQSSFDNFNSQSAVY